MMVVMNNSNNSILSRFVRAYDESSEMLPPKGGVTLHQRALFLIWIVTATYGAFRYLCPEKKVSTDMNQEKGDKNDVVVEIIEKTPTNPISTPRPTITIKDASFSIFIIGLILMYYFFCDYLHYFPKAIRSYNRDLFVFLTALLFLIAAYFTCEEVPGDGKLLNRHQTEEWKGWMQVMFVWYHYFRATETYNAVRIYIAAYVLMTGFGNFSFFWVRKDYSLRRVLKMLFRLNFLVAMTTLVVDNSYMLYYICAMHTFWFLSVYALMYPLREYNNIHKVMVTKLAIYFVLVFIIFDIPGTANIVFAPFSRILNYEGSLHEWIFRSKLDHYATFVGMICAYNHPNFERFLNYIQKHKWRKSIVAAIFAVLLLINGVWYKYVFVLNKYAYNKVHPYTSFIPILSFIFVRNSTAWMRSRHLHLFASLGKITLETYISQLHIYLQANAKELIVYIPDYPLLNFMANTFIYLYMSKLLFHGTVTLNEYIFPSDTKAMWRNLFVIASSFTFAYLVSSIFGVLYVSE